MSTSAAGHLSPAYPERAAWGTAAKLRAWQEEAFAAYLERGDRLDGMSAVRAQHTLLELVSYTPGRG